MNLDVVIPAFNAERTVARAIKSAYEAGANRVIVIDDGSTDSTASVSRSAGADVVTQVNSGAAAARRAGLRLVDAMFVVMLDADDALVSAGVSSAVARLESSDPRVSALVCLSVDVDAGGEALPSTPWLEGVTVRSLYARGHAPVPPAAVLWRSTHLKRVYEGDPAGLWPRYAEDYELLIRAALLGRVNSLATVMCRYSRFGGKSALNPERSIESAMKIREHYAEVAGIAVRRMSRSRVLSLKLRKRSSAYRKKSQVIIRAALLLAAALLDPYYLQISISRLKIFSFSASDSQI